MKEIWKYEMQPVGEQTVMLPSGAELLSVKEQDDRPMLYALVDPELTTEPWIITPKATGEPIEDVYSLGGFIGTVMLRDGTYVLHFYGRRLL